MQGRRRPDITVEDWFGKYPGEGLVPGDYFKFGTTMWGIKAPNGAEGMIREGVHGVEVHGDGSITVTPSIVIHAITTGKAKREGWHGYLERGIWRAV